MNKYFLSVLIILVAASAGYGLWTVGAPSTERARRIDTQRLNDLQQISYSIDQYWVINNKLPTSLNELQLTRNISISGIVDPETNTPYEFSPKNDDSYVICATFSLPSSPTDQKTPMLYQGYPTDVRGPSFWNHATGRTCFNITVSKPPKISQ